MRPKLDLTEQITRDLPPYDDIYLESEVLPSLMAPDPPSAPNDVGRVEGLADGTPALEDPNELVQRRRASVLAAKERSQVLQELGQRLAITESPGTALVTADDAALARKAVTSIAALTPATDVAIITSIERRAIFESLLLRPRASRLSSAVEALSALDAFPGGTEDEEDAADRLWALERLATEAARGGHQATQAIQAIEKAIQTMEANDRCPSSAAHYVAAALVASHQPIRAARVLTHRESLGRALPQASYRLVLDALVAPTSGVVSQRQKALAWDLFAHMRLVAHPHPTLGVWTTMLNACADPIDPQPERALDFWAQVTDESGLEPDAAAYTAVVLACARVRAFYPEALRLFREMLGKHEARLGVSAVTGYEPSLDIYKALLEGAKRHGDLTRARWILAEMLRLAPYGGPKPDEDALASVFHAYAALKPQVMELREAKAVQVGGASEEKQPEAVAANDVTPPLAPQTSREALLEADRLFDWILDSKAVKNSTARLVNAYLSVHLAHAPLEDALDLEASVFARSGSRPNGWTHLAILERLSHARGKRERRVLAEQLPGRIMAYDSWLTSSYSITPGLTRTARDRQRHLIGLGPRQIERTCIAIVRSLVLVNQATTALDRLDTFRSRYPPDLILRTFKQAPHLTRLRAHDPNQVLEDDVPPHVLFHDVESLHHALVRQGDVKGIGKLKWICVGYEVALRKRRQMRLKGEGAVSDGEDESGVAEVGEDRTVAAKL